MSYMPHSMATLRRCQEIYDNLTPPDPDHDLPDGCCEDDYEEWDDEGYSGILGEG
jgi:hypothetical protein